MSETTEQATGITQPSEGTPRVPKDRAISFLVPFAKVKNLLSKYPAPKRPNRNRPVNLTDLQLRRELEAWDAASDEALQAMEDDLPE
jgi:hypothetical protein